MTLDQHDTGHSMTLNVGDKAPDFTLATPTGTT